MTVTAPYSFSEGKAKIDLLYNPTWSVQWAQDGACFSGNIPYSIPEADIAKYLEMEKVTDNNSFGLFQPRGIRRGCFFQSEKNVSNIR